MSAMRLDKLLAQMGVGTRSEVKKFLKTSVILVNGIPVKKPETKVDPDCDDIIMDGKKLSFQREIYLLFHKPSGCVTATQDNLHKTVMDYIDHERKQELFPVGRLDIDTEGLLLITNDGALAHHLLAPRHHVDKTYYVRATGTFTKEDETAFKNGIDIGEKQLTMPATLEIISTEPCEANLTICEGKFHQVKRMFAARGKEVTYLKRIAMGGIHLPEDLKAGEYRPLTTNEIDLLKQN